MRPLVAAALATVIGAAVCEAASSDHSPADAYLAPQNMIVLRLVRPDGSVREFERVLAHGGQLRSVGGWKGTERKGRASVEGPTPAGGVERYSFRRGRLVAYEKDGVSTNFAYGAARSRLSEEHSPLLASALPPPDAKTAAAIAKKTISTEYSRKWGRSGRLRFPYRNPNQSAAFWAELALALAALAFCMKRACLRHACVALCAASAACVLWSGSRGGVLALCAAFAMFAAVRRDLVFRLLRSRRFWIAAAVAAAAVVAWIAWKDPKFLTRGTGIGGGNAWSNRVRWQMWLAAPRMILDAAGGWGAYFDVGRAYMDWYQPLSEVSLPGSLINDHLTLLVGFSWPLRVGYAALWAIFLALSASVAIRRRQAFPLAMTVFWFVGSWFNPLFSAKALWLGPAAAVLTLAFGIRALRRRDAVAACIAAVAAPAALACAVFGFGRAWRSVDAPVPVRHVGGATFVNVRRGVPETWVVDTTGDALGGIFSAKGMRLFYSFNPSAESVAVVRTVDDLPTEGVERLVLGGTQGDAWLKNISSSAKAREHLPSAVVFVSPPFPPEAVPPALRDACDVVFLVGEFAARYGDAYAVPREGVVLVPGMELYIENWLGLSLGVPTE